MLAPRIRGWKLRWLFDNDVRVGAANSEGAYARTQRCPVRFPRFDLAAEVERAVRQLEMRIRLLEMKQPGNGPILDLQDGLDQSDTPAATSRCPTFAFAVPSEQKFVSDVDARNALFSPATSMGSPSGVPVP